MHHPKLKKNLLIIDTTNTGRAKHDEGLPIDLIA
jgi:hypothetical protein